MFGKRMDPPDPKDEFEAWTLQRLAVIANDVSWLKKFMWVLAAIMAASVGVKLL